MTSFVYAAVLFAMALGCAVLAPTIAQAQDAQATNQARYQACMDKTQTRPKSAFDDATQWEGDGGGHPARHCALAALVALGHYFEAAQGLETLADEVRANAAFKAQLLTQAANAWIAAGDNTRARAVSDAALTLRSGASDDQLANTLTVRARAMAGLGAYWDAADDLSRVLYTQPKNATALVLRGATYRQLDALGLALDDLNRALAVEPTHPEGLLERGIVKRLQGDKSGARTDWRQLIAAHPDSEAAREAGINLHALDSGIE